MSAAVRIGTRASLLATTQAELVADAGPRAARPRDRAGRGDHRGRPQPGRRHPARAGRRHRRLRQRAARRPAGRRGRRRGALAQGPADRRRTTASRSPPYPRARTRATWSSPATASPSASCPAGSRVGTGSPRRVAQLLALGLGLDVVGVRGNVDTRDRQGPIRASYDAVLLARAGLARIGRLEEVTEVLDPLQMLPAPGQGALAVECRADDDLRGRAGRARRPRPAGPPSTPSEPCWPPSRAAARRRSERWPSWSRARTARSCGCARSRCPPTARCRCACPPPATRRRRRGRAPGWPRRCSPTARGDLDTDSTRPQTDPDGPEADRVHDA